MNTKNLIIFDLDFTILSENSDHVILDLLSDKSREEVKEIEKTSRNWAKHMQKVFLKMKEENVNIEQVKNIIDNIKFNDGFNELFSIISENKDKVDSIIVSGANTLFLKWVISRHNLSNIFDTYYSNPAEEHNDYLIKIDQTNIHNCENCDDSQCKRIVVDQYIKNKNLKYERIFYLGDGNNDYCPALLFNEKDYLFPRENFPLFNKLFTKNNKNNLKCNLVPCKTAHCVIDIIKKYI